MLFSIMGAALITTWIFFINSNQQNLNNRIDICGNDRTTNYVFQQMDHQNQNSKYRMMQVLIIFFFFCY